MADTKTHRVELGARFSRVVAGEVVQYQKGDVVELTEEELARYAPGLHKPSRRNETEPPPAVALPVTATPPLSQSAKKKEEEK